MTQKQLLTAAIAAILITLFGTVLLSHAESGLRATRTPDEPKLLPVTTTGPLPPASEPPGAPEGYVLWKYPGSTNDALRLWKVAGEVVLTNTITDVEAVRRKAITIIPEYREAVTNKWVEHNATLTINLFDTDEKFYRLLIDGDVLVPQWSTDLAEDGWVSTDLRVKVYTTESNTEHRLKIEL